MHTHTHTHTHTQATLSISAVIRPRGFKVKPGYFGVKGKVFPFIQGQVGMNTH